MCGGGGGGGGGGWEIWSCAVTSGRQRLDKCEGWCRMNNLEALSCSISMRAGGQSVSKAVSILFIVHDARDSLTWKGNYYSQTPPSMCLPSVYLMSSYMTRSLPGLPPLYLHIYCKRSNAGGGNSLGTRLPTQPCGKPQTWIFHNVVWSHSWVRKGLIGQFHVPFQKLHVMLTLFNILCWVLISQKIRVGLCVCVCVYVEGVCERLSKFKIMNIMVCQTNRIGRPWYDTIAITSDCASFICRGCFTYHPWQSQLWVITSSSIPVYS